MPDNSLRETVRSDGLRVITKRLPSTKKVWLGITALVGSAYDPYDANGLFHFFEHMAFQGTTTKSVHELNRLRERYLLSSNASTGKLETNYYAEAVYTRFPELCDILFDIYQNSIFPDDAIEKEKEVVRNEIARNKDNDASSAYLALTKLLWRLNPIGGSGVGTPNGLERIDRTLLMETKAKWYVPSNTVVIGTGRIDHDALVAYAFNAIPLSNSSVKHTIWFDECAILPSSTEVVIHKPQREKAIILFGHKLPKTAYDDHRESAALNLLNRMLARGNDSILWREIRESRGFAYNVSGGVSGHNKLAFCSYFQAETLPARAQETKELMPELICDYPLDEDSFLNTKEGLIDKWQVSVEDPVDWFNTIQSRMVNRGQSIESLQRHLDKVIRALIKVQFQEVMALREQFIRPECLACAMIIPG